MLIHQSWEENISYWWHEMPEDDMFYRLCDNPFYPFRDIGNGFYVLEFVGGECFLGLGVLLLSLFFILSFSIHLGFYEVPTTCLVFALIIAWYNLDGTISGKQLIYSKEFGYLVRFEHGRVVMVEQNRHNLYIRLEKYIDGDWKWGYCIVLGGYLLDEIRISRIGHNYRLIRAMATGLAENLELNFLYWNEMHYDHNLRHTRTGRQEYEWDITDLNILFKRPYSYLPHHINPLVPTSVYMPHLKHHQRRYKGRKDVLTKRQVQLIKETLPVTALYRTHYD